MKSRRMQSWIRRCATISVACATIAAFAVTDAAAQAKSNVPDSAEFNDVIAKQEKAMDTAQKVMLRKIETQERAIRRSDVDPDLRKRSLDAIAEDRAAFEKDGSLPNSDELVVVVAG